ncbi:MAG: 30S ribosomal protein S4 [Dehalococcoidia bacterium]|nr:MAG: 30S ribosomal protein S4 [Dehalococcoidia bacterium]
MARYTEAVCRLCSRSGDKLMLKGDKCITECSLDKRPKPPGPQLGRRRRISDRGLQLREKQKVRYSYGMLEKQFRRFFSEAERQPGITGENLLVLLERRLDNVIYRLGFADSRAQARQLVQHGHILLNERKTDIPSCLVKEGDIITWHEGSKKSEYYKQRLQSIGGQAVAGWLSLDKKKLIGKIVSIPTPDDVEVKFDVASVVEHYSR